MSNLHQLVLFGSYTDRVLFDVVVVVVVEKSVCFNSYHHKSFTFFKHQGRGKKAFFRLGDGGGRGLVS